MPLLYLQYPYACLKIELVKMKNQIWGLSLP
jgi:hypothetical protein